MAGVNTMAQFWTDFSNENTSNTFISSPNWATRVIPANTTARFVQQSGRKVLQINQQSTTGQVYIECTGINTAGNTNVESLCKFSVNAVPQNPGSFGILLHRYTANPLGGFSLAFIPAYSQLSLFLNDDFTNEGANYALYNWKNNVM